MQRALDRDEGGLKSREVDRDDRVATRKTFGLGRGTAFDEPDPHRPRRGADATLFTLVKVAHSWPGAASFLGSRR